MWAMLDTGFISVVQHKDDPDTLLVRARAKGDIEAVFGPDTVVTEQPGADYLFRSYIPRAQVAQAMFDKVMALDYNSHAKDVALERSSPAEGRRDAYYATWSAMAKIQPIPPYAKTARKVTTTTTETYYQGRFFGSEYDWTNRRWRDDAVPTDDGDFVLEDDGRGGVRTVSLADLEQEEQEYVEWDACTTDMSAHAVGFKCPDCGHAAVFHPGFNDTGECIACDMELTMSTVYGEDE